MAAVVSDTSPIRALAHLGLLDLLRDIFGQVLVPAAVESELRKATPRLPTLTISQLPFIQVQSPQNQARVQQFLQTLDPGESEALVLALEVQAPTLLMDETKARQVAQQLSLNITGTLGVLVRAKRRGLIPEVRLLMDRLQNELLFFVSPKVRADILRLAGE